MADILFELVLRQVPAPEKRKPYTDKDWISDESRRLWDQRCSLRRQKKHCKAEARRLTRAIAASLKADRKQCTIEVGEQIAASMNGGDQDEAYCRLKFWYRHMGDRPQKSTHEDMDKLANEFDDLFAALPPTGDPLPIFVDPAPVDDSVPDESEILHGTNRLRSNLATGPSQMKSEHVKEWRDDAHPKPLPGTEIVPEPRPEKWNRVVDLVQHIFETGSIPQKLTWSILACLPKRGGGHRGIGLLETIWKLVQAIIGNRIKKAIKFHDALHGFCFRRGTGTALIEMKLHRELADMLGKILFQMFLDLKKAFDTLNRERLLEVMAAYGVGPRLLQLIRAFWAAQKLALRQAGYYGRIIIPGSGITQGGLDSGTFFNILADAVFRAWAAETLEHPVHGNRPIGEILSLLYADDNQLSAMGQRMAAASPEHSSRPL